MNIQPDKGLKFDIILFVMATSLKRLKLSVLMRKTVREKLEIHKKVYLSRIS